MSVHEFVLPDIGEGLAQAEIVRWHVAVGDVVSVDEPFIEVETDKAIVEIPAPVAGVVKQLGGDVGDVIEVGGVLATFEVSNDQKIAETVPPESSSPDSKHGSERAEDQATPATPVGARVKASPAVRKAARERGIDLSQVVGSGSRGHVTMQDLEQVSAPNDAPSPVQHRVSQTALASGDDVIEPMSGLRRRIAEATTQAWRDIPHIYNTHEIDATQLVAARHSLNEECIEQGVKLSYLPFFVKACVMALRAHPRFNASIDSDKKSVTYRHRINIGIATATDEGLLVPVLHDADKLSLLDLARQIQSLAGVARSRKVSVAQLSGGTFTISNFGSYSDGLGMPIIRAPEVAIAGFGRIGDKAVAEAGQVVVRPVLPVVVTTDHRLNDGAHLGAFTSTLNAYLREPIRLFGAN